MADIVYIVVPCYNEEEVLRDTAARLGEKLRALQDSGLAADGSRVLFVDDGSADGTWELIQTLHREDRRFSGLKLTRNRGHQNALLAGLAAAGERGDVTISIDADLQDDIDAMDTMLARYYAGDDIVYGVRGDRSSDTAFKRMTAQGFYKFMQALGVNVVYNHADYRLMSKRAVQGLLSFEEVNLFLRGIVPLIGYKTSSVQYQRGKRMAGESKYPLKKMIAFALDGITSFSTRPLRWITILGVLVFLVSIVMALYSIFVKLFSFTVTGWSTLMVSIWFLGGMNLLALGVVGEYIGKIYQESKGRPKYFIETILEDDRT